MGERVDRRPLDCSAIGVPVFAVAFLFWPTAALPDARRVEAGGCAAGTELSCNRRQQRLLEAATRAEQGGAHADTRSSQALNAAAA